MNYMRFLQFFSRILPNKNHYLPVFAQQATYIQQAAGALCQMMEAVDRKKWKLLEKEVKACEVQGDALLTEFHELLFESIFRRIRRGDIQTIAMNLDEFLDHINDAAKSVLLYMPDRIDPQIKELANYISAEADSLRVLVSFLGDLKGNYAKISMQCDRITELEHAADDAYEEYIGFIFTNEKNAIELMKYKNIAEMLEAATDAAKRVSDSVRKIILRYID
ncbi:MAG: DUF47 family protein [Bacteroidales bacterium]|nr:DUF47 family protein [Bacteroidales bacterium]